MTCANCTCNAARIDIVALFEAEINLLRLEFAKSLVKHGNWEKYKLDDKFVAISNEYMEAAAARDCGDIHGEHGVIAELRQTAAMCIKTIITEGK